jgi:hypothetical protein
MISCMCMYIELSMNDNKFTRILTQKLCSQ